ncbi:glycerol dehydratase reactivase beta/small subunit family protein [Brachyspira pulli]|uniref:glycerol dehydratase reactivase beta/small subunit family protein n=1 Tax=Brachyspira pulli TaxID=310721 RepID=UPI003004E8C5
MLGEGIADMDIPSIIVYDLGNVNPILMEQVLYGIEEEGIPYMVEKKSGDGYSNVKEASYKAAISSQLSVGIAVNDENIAVHYANLDEDKPLFLYPIKSMNIQNVRNIGSNSARLVKGIYFILDD